VCTAPEGLLKGSSTIFHIFEGNEWWNAPTSKLRPIAKVWLSPTLSKAQRAEVHALILNQLDAGMFLDDNVDKAVSETVKSMERQGVAVHSTFAPPDTPLTVEQIKSAEEATSARVAALAQIDVKDIEKDGERLWALMKKFTDRVGRPAVSLHDGKVFVHPDLARELDCPGNEEPREMLLDMGSIYEKKLAQ
jgi:hypothetical protein